MTYLKIIISTFLSLILSMNTLYGTEKNMHTGENQLIAKAGNSEIFFKELLGGSSPENFKDFIKEQLELEKKFVPEITVKIDDNLLNKMSFQIQILGLQKKLKEIVDKEILKKDIDKIVSEDNIKSHFAKRRGDSDSSGNERLFLHHKSLMDAYNYLDQLPKSDDSIKKAYDKFLINVWNKSGKKPADYGLQLWKSYAYNERMRRIISDDYKYYHNLLSGKITEEMKDKVRKKLILMEPERISNYILCECSIGDEKVKKYLDEKSKSGKTDKDFEQEVIDKWYLEELKKLGCELYTDKYGTLEEIMAFKEKELEKLLLEAPAPSN